MTEVEQPPSQPYNYSVKLETTQKCINVTVHVYWPNHEYEEANMYARQALSDMRWRLEKEGFVVAPLEVGKKDV